MTSSSGGKLGGVCGSNSSGGITTGVPPGPHCPIGYGGVSGAASKESSVQSSTGGVSGATAKASSSTTHGCCTSWSGT